METFISEVSNKLRVYEHKLLAEMMTLLTIDITPEAHNTIVRYYDSLFHNFKLKLLIEYCDNRETVIFIHNWIIDFTDYEV